MHTYNVFLWFSNLLLMLNKNTIHNQNPWAKFSRGHFTFLPHVCFIEKNVQFYYCHSIEWCILVERVRKTEKNATFPGSVNLICRTHLSREIRHSNSQICNCACAVLFFWYLSTTLAQLLSDVIKHAVAHFAPFLAPFLFVLTILCFEDTKIC